MDLARLMSKLAAIGGMQGSVTEAEEKCSECGKVHEGDCAVEEAKKPDADKDGIPDWADKDKEKVEEAKKPDDDGDGVPNWADKNEGEDDTETVKENNLATLRALAGITECGDMEDEMSPLSSVSDTATPIQVIGSTEAQPEVEMPGSPEMAAPAEPQKARYTLTMQNGDSQLSMTTDTPDEIIHIMKLAGVKGEVKAEKQMPGQETSEPAEEEKEVDEAWGNTPAPTKEREPKAYGDIRDWGQKGTGQGKPGSGTNRPAGQGDNPLGEQAMMEAYKKFKAGK